LDEGILDNKMVGDIGIEFRLRPNFGANAPHPHKKWWAIEELNSACGGTSELTLLTLINNGGRYRN